jgi:hypothetical protein
MDMEPTEIETMQQQVLHSVLEYDRSGDLYINAVNALTQPMHMKEFINAMISDEENLAHAGQTMGRSIQTVIVKLEDALAECNNPITTRDWRATIEGYRPFCDNQ